MERSGHRFQSKELSWRVNWRTSSHPDSSVRSGPIMHALGPGELSKHYQYSHSPTARDTKGTSRSQE